MLLTRIRLMLPDLLPTATDSTLQQNHETLPIELKEPK